MISWKEEALNDKKTQPTKTRQLLLGQWETHDASNQ